MKKLQITSARTVASFLLPSFVGFFIFVVIPIVISIGLSFTNYSGGPVFKFQGLRNYIVAFQNDAFRSSMKVTFIYVAYTVSFQIVLGLCFALLLSRPFKSCSFFRSTLYLPNILSSVAVGLAFMLIFEPNNGVINSFLQSIGLPTSRWLAGEKTALSVIIFVTVWQNFGYYMVLFIGGLQGINISLYEASNIDGANWFQQFKSVTMPGLSPVMFYSVTIAIIRGFQVFDYIFIMTGGQHGGGPVGSTSALAFDIYKSAFVQYRFGYASAESVILMLIVITITVIQQYGQRKWVVYDVV